MAALAFACRALRTLAAQAVGFCQLYDEAFSNDAQLQSARASLAANSEELSRARQTAAASLGVIRVLRLKALRARLGGE
ncbi:hypothetical protein PQR57_26675 [Paraburkholderia dipogonis]|jgi:hypothetical protein|uniref:Uncharacterized protein n=1 Tax=Paraburkholderia dipogonis TaxID=1211383 RepID=A0ABW9AVM7_9BURK